MSQTEQQMQKKLTQCRDNLQTEINYLQTVSFLSFLDKIKYIGKLEDGNILNLEETQIINNKRTNHNTC